MVTTAATPRTRFAALAVRARNIVDSGLCPRTSLVPDWRLRTKQLTELAAASARSRRAALASVDDDTIVDLMVLSYLRGGTPYVLWDDTPSAPGRGSGTSWTPLSTTRRWRPRSASVWAHAGRWCRSWRCGTSVRRDNEALVIVALSPQDCHSIRRDLPGSSSWRDCSASRRCSSCIPVPGSQRIENRRGGAAALPQA
ncbi:MULTISPECIES: hypothetical protein [unclassified Streptomyces]|uniref:hypothetical protein n=1 Tax=unclassified Streptomyces TaxID=2593676 RepID=UPI0033B231B4